MIGGRGGSSGVLRLRNLAMIENIRRAEDPEWRERLERQQVVARLGRMFGRAEDPLRGLQDHAEALREELRAQPSCASDGGGKSAARTAGAGSGKS